MLNTREYRIARIVAGVVLLPVIAAAAFALMWAIAEESGWAFLLVFGLSVYLAVIYAGIQAILYSLLMEFCVWRLIGVNPMAVLVSSLLGLACGFSVFLLLGEFLPTLLFSGFAAGLVAGASLWHMKRRGSTRGIWGERQ
jgi:hypothetical protein